MSTSEGSNKSKSIWDGLVKPRPNWAAGDGYQPGDDVFLETNKKESDSKSTYSSNSRSAYMDGDRYEPSQYGERGYVARDGYARDARSDAYEQSNYGGGRSYSRDPPAYVQTNTYYSDGGRRRDQQRSYDDQDVDGYYEKTRVTKYKRYPEERGLAPYDDRDRERARSQDVAMYRREDRDRGSRSRNRRDSGSSSDGEESSNTPLKKWAATFAGAAVGGMAAQRLPSKHHEGGNWVPTAIGAVIGGLVGREVEKKVYEHKDKRREREHEERY